MEIKASIENIHKSSLAQTTPPKFFETLAYFFPTFHIFLVLVSVISLILTRSLWVLPIQVFCIYILPVVLWRLFQWRYPLTEGQSYIGRNEMGAHPWLIAYQLQSLFISFSMFERILILIPGAFSAWLRLWGSSIGKKVTWTPRVDIIDRTSLEIKNFSFFGDKVYISAHIIMRKNNRLLLLHKKIKIGEKCLIGFASQLGPGANIADNEMLPASSRAYMNKIVRGVANENID